VGVKPKEERVQRKREHKALIAAKVEHAIEKELLDRLIQVRLPSSHQQHDFLLLLLELSAYLLLVRETERWRMVSSMLSRALSIRPLSSFRNLKAKRKRKRNTRYPTTPAILCCTHTSMRSREILAQDEDEEEGKEVDEFVEDDSDIEDCTALPLVQQCCSERAVLLSAHN
jgi:hypothetical protein